VSLSSLSLSPRLAVFWLAVSEEGRHWSGGEREREERDNRLRALYNRLLGLVTTGYEPE